MNQKTFKFIHLMMKVSEIETDLKLPMNCYKSNRKIEMGQMSEDYLKGFMTVVVSERMSVGRQKYLNRCGFFNK